MNKFVSDKAASIPLSGIRSMLERARRMKDVIGLEIGEPDFDTPANIRDAAKVALDERFTHYTPSSGFEELRKAIAEKIRIDNGIEADPLKEIVVTPGACSSVYCSLFAMVNPGEEVLVPDPGWPHYDACINLAGGVPIHYSQSEENDFRPDPAEVAEKVTEKTKAIIINTPSNPTGAVLSRKDLEGLAQIAVKNDIAVISDEVYEKILYDDAKHISIATLPGMRDRTITIFAFSKTYAMTGWRVGYSIANEEIATQISKLVLYSATCVNSVAQRASITALTDPQDSVVEMVREYMRRRDFFVRRLNAIDGISCKMPKGAFYAFANVKRLGMSSFDCANFLLDEARVSTVPGSTFGQHGEGYLRMSYATSIENLERATARIQEALEKKKN